MQHKQDQIELGAATCLSSGVRSDSSRLFIKLEQGTLSRRSETVVLANQLEDENQS